MEAQRGQTTHPKSHIWGLTELGFKQKVLPRASALTQERIGEKKSTHRRSLSPLPPARTRTQDICGHGPVTRYFSSVIFAFSVCFMKSKITAALFN